MSKRRVRFDTDTILVAVDRWKDEEGWAPSVTVALYLGLSTNGSILRRAVVAGFLEHRRSNEGAQYRLNAKGRRRLRSYRLRGGGRPHVSVGDQVEFVFSPYEDTLLRSGDQGIVTKIGWSYWGRFLDVLWNRLGKRYSVWPDKGDVLAKVERAAEVAC